ncbi:MAG: nucleotide pyrophosphohydrolase [Candidatus Lokiarchaeota archaeon]|nr:nucleotide pyrophosphohydrolase [Candidatus Lokiarchaeota archaeon]
MKINEFQQLMKDIYFERDQKRGVEKTFIWLVEEVGELAKTFNKRYEKDEIDSEFADVLAWLCSVANLLNVNLEEMVTKKYSNCPRCKKKPCKCEIM